MTIFARDADTGMAKWVYQMTPHDEWDYDGVNEMILVDIESRVRSARRSCTSTATASPTRMDRVTGELLVAEKYDPAVNWATHVDMKTGRPQVVRSSPPPATGRTSTPRGSARPRWAPRTSSRRRIRRRPGSSMCRPTTCAWTTSRSGRLHGGPALRRRDPEHVPAGKVSDGTWAISSPGTPARARSSGRCPRSSRSGAARSPPPATWSSTVRSKAT
jgi:lanthanide-dependent methanol dehydrogenase